LPKPPQVRHARPTSAKPRNKKSVLRQTHKKTDKKAKKTGKAVPHKLMALTGKQRTFLRGLAHELNAVLQVGKGGATAALLSELGRALDSHELVKVRVLRECPEELEVLTAKIEKKLQANVVGTLGRILVLYRRNPEQCRIALPVTKAKASAKNRDPLPFDDDEPDDVSGANLNDDGDDEAWEE